MLSFRGYTSDDPVLAARVRALIALAAFASGLVIARRIVDVPSFAPFCASLACAALAIFVSSPLSRVALLIAVICSGIGVGVSRWHESPRDSIATLVASGSLITADLRVIADPVKTRSGHSFEAEVIAIHDDRDSYAASGGVSVRISHTSIPAVRAGDLVQVTARFESIDSPRNPGEFDRRYRAAEDRHAGQLLLRSPSSIVTRTERDLYGTLLRFRADLKSRVDAAVELAAGSPPDSQRLALFSALFTGDRRGDHEEVQRRFLDTGLAHALSISGFHIAVLTALLGVLLTFAGERGMPMFLVLVIVLLAYLSVVVPSAPVNRSIAMVVVVGCVEWSGRRYDRVTLLIWIAFGLLIVSPSDLWNLGYQLSVGLTVLLMWCAQSAKERMFGSTLRGLMPRPLTLWDIVNNAITASIASGILCAAASMPIILHHTGRITPLAALASIVISPLIVVLLLLGYIALILGACVPLFARLLAEPLAWIADLVLACTRLFDAIPGSTMTAPSLTAAWTLAATVTAIVVLTVRMRKWRATAAIAGIIAWAIFGTADTSKLPRDVLLRVDCLDVGSGTCMILRSGDAAMMFDCGSMRHADARTILRSMNAIGVTRIPVAVISHPDADHFGLLAQVIRYIPVEQVVVSERFLAQADSPLVSDCVQHLSAAKIPLRTLDAGDSFEFGEVVVRVISPDANAQFRQDNDHSLVLEFSHPSLSRPALLLTGDIQDDAIKVIQSRIVRSPIIVEAPHHGSSRPVAINWLRELRPTIVMQSTDASRLDDPRWDAVREVSTWFSTAASGALSFELKRDARVEITETRFEP